MDLDTNYNNNEVDQGVYFNIKPEEDVTIRDGLDLDIDDSTFIQHANRLIKDDEEFYKKKYNLPYRQEQNEKYFLGRQLDDEKLKEYQARYVDNIIWESMAYLKPMALSQMPDMIALPGNKSEESQQIADEISAVIDSDIKRKEYRKVLGLAFIHRPIYFFGAIKPFWNPEKGKDGDYDFREINPKNLILDHKSPDRNPDNMDHIGEYIELSVKEWVMRFPKKEQQFYEELQKAGHFRDGFNQDTEAGMNSIVKGVEMWFDWYQKENGKYKKYVCVGWFYKNLVFGRMKHPYYDWTGEVEALDYQLKPIGEQQIKEDTIQMAITKQPTSEVQTNKIFHNHFTYPRKPYIILGAHQFGKVPIDETSEIEQSRIIQMTYDKRGMQITDMLNRTRGKHVFTTDSGLKAEDLQEMDFNDPDQDILIKGKLSEVHGFIQGEQPNAALMQDMIDLRNRIFAKMGTQGPSRGQVDNDTAATNNQLSREGDFSRADDLTEETINYAALEMANWILQFIKLFYTEDHFRRTVGQDGQFVFSRINRDMIEDGMEINITASGTDKLKAQQRAMDMAKLGIIDPLSYYNDLALSDPAGRTEKLLLFKANPMMYLQKFVYGNDLNGMVDTLNGQGSAEAYQHIMLLQQGVVPQIPAQVNAGYFQVFSQFIQSPAIEKIIQNYPQIRTQLAQFIEAIMQGFQSQQIANGSTPPPGTPGPEGAPQSGGPQLGMGGGQGNIGPTTGNPQPGNTSQVPIMPGQ